MVMSWWLVVDGWLLVVGGWWLVVGGCYLPLTLPLLPPSPHQTTVCLTF